MREVYDMVQRGYQCKFANALELEMLNMYGRFDRGEASVERLEVRLKSLEANFDRINAHVDRVKRSLDQLCRASDLLAMYLEEILHKADMIEKEQGHWMSITKETCFILTNL